MSGTGKVTVFYRETRIVCLDEDVEIIVETPEGITVRHTYRKGTRLEFIPREKLEGIVYEDIKPDRKLKAAKAAKPKPEPASKPTPEPDPEPVAEKPVVAEENTGDEIFSESEDFDDGGDDFDDDDFG